MTHQRGCVELTEVGAEQLGQGCVTTLVEPGPRGWPGTEPLRLLTEPPELLCAPNRAWGLWLCRSVLSRVTTRHVWLLKLQITEMK